MKICTKCKEEKSAESFGFDSHSNRLKSHCKQCLAIKRRERYDLNKERLYQKSDTYKQYQKKYKETEEYKEKHNLYRRTSKHHKEWRDKYRKTESQIEYRNSYLRRPHVMARNALRNRLRSAMKGEYRKGMAVDNLGCSIISFKKHLESLFKDGMSWDNYGEWHIDHIKPLSIFNLENDEDVKIACNYKNMQPLWKRENLTKGNKYEL